MGGERGAVGRSVERYLTSPLLAGGAILILGFGVILSFWRLGNWRDDVPGLWDYRSATIGDAVLLPLLAGSLVALGNRLPPSPGERRPAAAAFLLGSGIGLAIQAVWLLDPDPQLNWTVPEPHAFNAPGYYHAAFFVVACGLFAAWTIRFLVRLRRSRSSDAGAAAAVLRSASLSLALACGTGFAGLVAMDGIYIEGVHAAETWTAISATIAACAGILVALGALGYSIGRDRIGLAARGLRAAATLAVAIWLVGVRPRGFGEQPLLLLIPIAGIAVSLALGRTLGAADGTMRLDIASAWLALPGTANIVLWVA